MQIDDRFVTGAPSHRTAYDLFAGRWASDLGEVVDGLPRAGVPMFRSDVRPAIAAEHLGRGGRLDGYDVLELGPLEAAHTYQLEQLGARSVTAVEANAEAYLKCLIVKNMLGLDRSTFHLGDAVGFLDAPGPRYDLLVCCGILYHMFDPLDLIRAMAARADRVFIWTHYHDARARLPRYRPVAIARDGLQLTAHEVTYRHRTLGQFLGGNRPKTRWMELPGILAALAHYGLSEVTIIRDEPEAKNGPAVTLAARRPG